MYYLPKRKKAEECSGKKRTGSSLGKADREFSRYIRLRDAMPGGYFRCISCGRILPIGQADCGHYHSRRHMSTRFDEDNCHAECRYCNRFSADHLIGYRANLIRKIGAQRYTLLEVRKNGTVKLSDFELEELAKHYRRLADGLQKEKGIKL